MIRKILVLIAASTLVGCALPQSSMGSTAPNSPFTHGNVQLTLKNGVTTQTEVLETFGAPNVATVDSDGNEVWTTRRMQPSQGQTKTVLTAQ